VVRNIGFEKGPGGDENTLSESFDTDVHICLKKSASMGYFEAVWHAHCAISITVKQPISKWIFTPTITDIFYSNNGKPRWRSKTTMPFLRLRVPNKLISALAKSKVKQAQG
jgi:hypothetical protein